MLVIHHLNRSRSERIVWLAEELGLPYRIVHHKREVPSKRAPASLKAINPLGKAPAIEDGEVKLAESGAIVEYLLEKYGQGRLQPAVGDPARPRYLHWMHAAESTLMVAPLTDLLTLAMNNRSAPLEAFLRHDYQTLLGHLEEVLGKQDYVAGDAFTAADIMVSFPLSMIEVELFPGVKLQASLDDFPAVRAYLRRLRARPAWQRAVTQFIE
ncbi:MAG: glutathione S-transferase [Rhodocyclaceae bacterium]|jgi:glutathione S-transferase|nr:glutathione S-transferase [Rhodocyclaceae bacterium]